MTPLPLVRYAWLVVVLLWPVALLNYLDRQLLATMKSSMVGDIPSIANKADWGLVLGCFKWTYALLSPIGGFIAAVRPLRRLRRCRPGSRARPATASRPRSR